MNRKTKWILAGAGITAFSAAMIGVAAGVSRKISKFVVDHLQNQYNLRVQPLIRLVLH